MISTAPMLPSLTLTSPLLLTSSYALRPVEAAPALGPRSKPLAERQEQPGSLATLTPIFFGSAWSRAYVLEKPVTVQQFQTDRVPVARTPSRAIYPNS